MEYLEAASTRREPRLVREEAGQPPLLEFSDLNPLAQRRPGGIWNEHLLPIMDWEDAEHRVVVPGGLQESLAIDEPVLRWAAIKYQVVIEKHHRDMLVIRRLSYHLNDWMYHGEEIGQRQGNLRVLFRDNNGRWYSVSIGVDKNGSRNVITIVGGSDKKFRDNRLRGMHRIVRREK